MPIPFELDSRARIALVSLFTWACVSVGCAKHTTGSASNEPPTAGAIGTTTQATIGVSGGVLATTDGAVSLTLPAGAVGGDVPLSVTVKSSAGVAMAQNILAPVYDFAPSGTTFSQPVTLAIKVNSAPSAAQEAMLAYLDANNTWQYLTDSSFDADKGIVTATTTHFTVFSVVAVTLQDVLCLLQSSPAAFCATGQLTCDASTGHCVSPNATKSVARSLALIFSTINVDPNVCPNGGQQVAQGVDLNGNGKLDPNEITSYVTVCNGANGAVALVKITPLSNGSTCPSGGSTFAAGVDINGDGILQAQETSQTASICNGPSAGALPNMGLSTLSASPSMAPADGHTSIALTLNVVDASNRPVVGQNVTFRAQGAATVLSPVAGVTGSDGSLRTSVTSSWPESKTIMAVVGTGTISTGVVFSPTTQGPVSLAQSRLTLSATRVNADGSSPVRASVQLKDVHGNPNPNVLVAFRSEGVDAVWSTTRVSTDAFGVATATLTSYQAGATRVIAAFADQSLASTLTFYQPSTDRSSLVPNTAQALVGNNTINLLLTAIDTTGTPLVGIEVSLALVGATTQPAVTVGATDQNGHLSVAVASRTPGMTRARVAFENVSLMQNLIFYTALPSTCDGQLLLPDVPNPPAAADHVLIADVDNNGLLDMLSTNGSEIVLSFGDGNGLFSMVNTVRPTVLDQDNRSIVSMAVGYIDTDANIDLILGTAGDTTTVISILLGDGLGGFFEARTLSNQDAPTQVLLGDINNDGAPDIVSQGPSGNPGIAFGDGHGNFAAMNVQTWNTPGPIALGDVTGNGNIGIFLAGGDGRVLVGVNNGQGTLTTQQVVSPLPSTTPDFAPALALTDFNADGKLDLLCASEQSWTAYRGDGQYHFVPVFTSTGPSSSVQAISSRDLNADGYADVVMLAQGALSTWMGAGNGNFNMSQNMTDQRGLSAPASIAFADINRDGVMDFASSKTKVSVSLGHPEQRGFFSEPVRTIGGGGNPYGDISYSENLAVDLNGDDLLDIANLPPYGPLSILMNLGHGAFSAPSDHVIPHPVASLHAADFNGDGVVDLAMAYVSYTSGPWSQDVSIWPGVGDGNFLTPVEFTVAAPFDANAIVMADFNEDGRMDLAVTSWPANPVVMLNSGDANLFFPPVSLGPVLASAIFAEDFNGDGHADVVTEGGSWMGNGDGTFGPYLPFDQVLPTYPVPTTVVDWNVDGKLDIIGAQVMYGTGDGHFSVDPNPLPVQPCRQAVVKDLNGDGLLDMVGCAGSDVEVALASAYGDISGTHTFYPNSAMLGLYSLPVTGDFNGDGRVDVMLPSTFGDGSFILLPNQGCAK